MGHNRRISVIGLGYVGLPVAAAFARAGVPTVGFDISAERVAELRAGHDRTHEVDVADLKLPGLVFTTDPVDLKTADFHIVTVPTPTDASNRPDLSPLHKASQTVGRQLKKGDIVVYESTVYPGVTETECVPILERESGLTWKTDFNVAYSPERINPGDRQRRFETILKVVSADTPATLEIVDAVYGSVVRAGTYRAASIMVAEAAKAVENTQRDLNIALINELALIFDRLEIDTRDVLEAAGTKWNFLPFRPGLVGGHCIGVDPFYLTHVAEQVGYNSRVILAGRRVNDGMGLYVANRVVRNLMRRGWNGRPVVTVLGMTFKENVPDVRNTRVADIVRELRNFGILAQVHDPEADADDVRRTYGFELKTLDALAPADAVVLAVAHKTFVDAGWSLVRRLLKNESGYVADVQGVLDRNTRPADITLWRL
ncbi:nucleotide sugar dehydrogenase [Reyranella sp. CPCC 100927]|uniref:nucleotide sugar dehydrogenase n=1 Tax=Reyranella sp. CPCC 100927 TaxID=2599616 RepID=UPI0011B58F3C|nr:nucleotide sugar dehydrogenase [Reyranella sp. CPCC 100927]TWT08803.1 nucleotide sugar dehydrogenase [Reyranella sp. CPCC 100927]